MLQCQCQVRGEGRGEAAAIMCAPELGSDQALVKLVISVVDPALCTDLFLLIHKNRFSDPETQGLSVTQNIILNINNH